jgi:hypothetical protein
VPAVTLEEALLALSALAMLDRLENDGTGAGGTEGVVSERRGSG